MAFVCVCQKRYWTRDSMVKHYKNSKACSQAVELPAEHPETAAAAAIATASCRRLDAEWHRRAGLKKKREVDSNRDEDGNEVEVDGIVESAYASEPRLQVDADSTTTTTAAAAAIVNTSAATTNTTAATTNTSAATTNTTTATTNIITATANKSAATTNTAAATTNTTAAVTNTTTANTNTTAATTNATAATTNTTAATTNTAAATTNTIAATTNTTAITNKDRSDNASTLQQRQGKAQEVQFIEASFAKFLTHIQEVQAISNCLIQEQQASFQQYTQQNEVLLRRLITDLLLLRQGHGHHAATDKRDDKEEDVEEEEDEDEEGKEKRALHSISGSKRQRIARDSDSESEESLVRRPSTLHRLGFNELL
ncbi:hypothetical protein BGZ98_004591 [Dissophora globulifera]|nr:hypothetical protein BGZ98_004591 [Dissophora globulifera]